MKNISNKTVEKIKTHNFV